MKWLETERRKLEGMTAGKKLEYIWQYYRLWIVAALSAAALVLYLAVHIAGAVRETHLYVLFVNTYAEVGNGSPLWKGYVERYAVDTFAENVVFDTGNFFNMAQGDVTGNHYYEKAVVLLDGGIADAVVMDREGLCALGAGGRLMDWDDPRMESLREQYSGRLLTVPVADGDGTREVAVGVDLSDCRLVGQERAYADCALGVSAEARQFEAIGEFLEYLLTE